MQLELDENDVILIMSALDAVMPSGEGVIQRLSVKLQNLSGGIPSSDELTNHMVANVLRSCADQVEDVL